MKASIVFTIKKGLLFLSWVYSGWSTNTTSYCNGHTHTQTHTHTHQQHAHTRTHTPVLAAFRPILNTSSCMLCFVSQPYNILSRMTPQRSNEEQSPFLRSVLLNPSSFPHKPYSCSILIRPVSANRWHTENTNVAKTRYADILMY